MVKSSSVAENVVTPVLSTDVTSHHDLKHRTTKMYCRVTTVVKLLPDSPLLHRLQDLHSCIEVMNVDLRSWKCIERKNVEVEGSYLKGGINASKVPDTDGIPHPQLDRHKTRITILPDVQVTPLCPSKAVEKIRAELECNREGECLTSLFLADVKPVDFWPH